MEKMTTKSYIEIMKIAVKFMEESMRKDEPYKIDITLVCSLINWCSKHTKELEILKNYK